MVIQADWPELVRVTAPSVYNGSLGGLCGNYNGHQHDDLRTPNGILVNSPQGFGDSWRDGSLSAHCVESNRQTHENQSNPLSITNYNSTQYCGIMTLTSGPFAACQSRVDPSDHVEECVEDMREARDPTAAMCEALRDYALLCQQTGITVGDWRNTTGCGKNVVLTF